MGTRSLTVVLDNWNNEEIVVMYRQMDGYPSGHGADLGEFLKDFTIVNGIGITENRRVANGMGCLAAQIVAYFKDGPGGIYLHSANTRNCGEEYVYTVYYTEGELYIKVEKTYGDVNLIYDGAIKDFDPNSLE